MKNMIITLPEDAAEDLKQMAVSDRRSVKGMAEKIIIDAVTVRSDGMTDRQYMDIVKAIKGKMQ